MFSTGFHILSTASICVHPPKGRSQDLPKSVCFFMVLDGSRDKLLPSVCILISNAVMTLVGH